MADPVYKASRGFHISNKDAAILGPAFEKLEKRLKRPPTPDDLVDEARKPSSPFHRFFEWRPEEQIRLYLRQRAYYILQSLDVILPDHGDQRVRGIIPVHDGSGGFMSTARAVKDRPDVIALQVQRAKSDARVMYERYSTWIGFAEFSPASDWVSEAKKLAYEA